MIGKTRNLLLYIHPNNKPADAPVIDELTRKMAAALRAYDSTGTAWRGFHQCTGQGCQARSTNTDYQLSNGVVTNSLAVHYLAYHRGEVPAEEIRKVNELTEDGVEPTESELLGRHQVVSAMR